MLHSSFLSNINIISVLAAHHLVEDNHVIEEEFNNGDIDFMEGFSIHIDKTLRKEEDELRAIRKAE